MRLGEYGAWWKWPWSRLKLEPGKVRPLLLQYDVRYCSLLPLQVQCDESGYGAVVVKLRATEKTPSENDSLKFFNSSTPVQHNRKMNEHQEERNNGSKSGEETRTNLISTVIESGVQATPISERIPKIQGSDTRPIGITPDMMQLIHHMIQARSDENPQEASY